mgnify:CR=1 FL=1
MKTVSAVELDAVDRKMLRILQADGRMTNAELARLLREQDRQHLASARLLEENAEHSRRRAQQARDLLARLVSEEGVSL